MGESLAAVAAVASIASATMSIAGGLASKAGHDLEAQQMREEAENARVAAEQDEAQRRNDLARMLGTQEAIRAGRGVELYSPTGLNIRETTIADAEQDIATARLNYLNKQRRYLLGAEVAKQQGTASLIGGVGSAAGSVANAAIALKKA